MTGHISSYILLHLLWHRYYVQAAVHSEEKITTVLSLPQIQKLNPGSHLTFTLIPDISIPGAYDHVVKGATYIIHLASPLATGNSIPGYLHKDFFIRPAIQGTINLLKAADIAGTMEGLTKHSLLKPISTSNYIPFVPGPYKSTFTTYATSKVTMLHYTEAWMAQEQPAFDVVYLHPGFILGHNESTMSHRQDVAKAYVKSLGLSIFGNQSYILGQSSCKMFTIGSSVKTIHLLINISLTEATFSIKLASYKD
ncbi:hypothetical protein B0T25DRAFT_592229 [Lasiosphaeria hispida]|uniref:NAD-dependent epimerase/dehydratase domain-containing protein n=1 Tax=Lasiosphaeria hispida TaxID=260671 RepID=A0AAJ0MD63_9PEZI|nr:hypothetical protein B0T25DRAFT_592229 [Lasiosphaeria hispida]